MNEGFLTLSAVKARGWSPKLIETVLGSPDKTKANPVYRSAPPVKLWARDRVEKAETDKAFVAYQGKRSKSSASMKAVAERKRQELLLEIKALPISVIVLPDDLAMKRGIRSWENRSRDDEFRDGSDASEETKQRWAVNYIRHHLCSYDRELERVAGKIGVSEAVAMIRRRVYQSIAEKYPTFAAECARQAEDRDCGFTVA